MEITPEDFVILHQACAALDAAGVAYVIGGGTAVVEYGRNRRTKDFDIFLNREVLRRAMDTLSAIGFCTTDTEKQWLYKAWQGETLVDLIVESRGRVRVDDDVMLRARMIPMHGYTFRIMGPEDTLFRKALTLTEGRPDWYDGISIIARQGDALDWTYFLARAQWNPRRVLSFLLFAMTELHRPPHSAGASSDNYLFQGSAPGPIPEWLVFALVQRIWLGGGLRPHTMRELTLRHAA
jgi:hypothetical protein